MMFGDKVPTGSVGNYLGLVWLTGVNYEVNRPVVAEGLSDIVFYRRKVRLV